MLVTVSGNTPEVHSTSWIAPNAVLAGDVLLGEQASVWYSAVVRADVGQIVIGARSNVQDGCVLHTDTGSDLRIGAGVTIGHRVMLHACQIDDDAMVGMGAIIMKGAVIGSGALIAAGSVVPEGAVVPPYSMVVGTPGSVRRPTSSDERLLVRASADMYVTWAAQHSIR